MSSFSSQDYQLTGKQLLHKGQLSVIVLYTVYKHYFHVLLEYFACMEIHKCSSNTVIVTIIIIFVITGAVPSYMYSVYIYI